jgi:hypothetical protein
MARRWKVCCWRNPVRGDLDLTIEYYCLRVLRGYRGSGLLILYLVNKGYRTRVMLLRELLVEEYYVVSVVDVQGQTVLVDCLLLLLL